MRFKAFVLSVAALAVFVCGRAFAAPCENCERRAVEAAAPVIALTYPEPYTGEPVKPRGITINVVPPVRPAPPPRWVPIRPVPPPVRPVPPHWVPPVRPVPPRPYHG